MMLTAVPEELTDVLDSATVPGRTILLALASDLDLSGRNATEWLIVTETALCRWEGGKPLSPLVPLMDDSALPSPGSSPQFAKDAFCFGEIHGCRVQSEVGSSYFQIHVHGVWIDLLRFSNALTPRFREACEQIEKLRIHREFEIPEVDESSSSRQQESRTLDGPVAGAPRSWDVLRRVALLLGPHLRKVLVIALLSVTAVVIELTPPWLQKILVDGILAGSLEDSRAGSWVMTLGGIMVGLAAVRIAASIIAVVKAKLSSEVGTQLTADLRTRMVDKLERLSVSFHDRNQVGLLMSRVVYDTEAMHTFMHHMSGGFLLQLLQLTAIGGTMFLLSPSLAFYALLPLPFVLGASWLFFKYLYARHHRYWEAVGRQASALTSLLSGIRVVKSFTQEGREHERFRRASDRLRDTRVGVDLGNATFTSLVGLLFGMGGLLVWYAGGERVLGQEMTLGSLMAFLAYLSMFYAPLTTVCEGPTWLSNFLSASHRIFDLLDTPITVSEPPTPRIVDRLNGEITFKDVGFSYDGNRAVLKQVNFSVSPGEFIGIVGRSGSGKSTLVSLVSRLYDADSGVVAIDGINVREFSSQTLRRRVGVVAQEPCLFPGSIKENIAYGDPGAPPERILAAAASACAHDYIMRSPFGYDTILGERGQGLSGGERQRLSIARAILYEPEILILDEATSSVDAESERLIQCALERFSEGRTTLVIAHRLSTLEKADRLLVMDMGRLAEQGTHDRLLEANGLYARLVRLQFGSARRGPANGNDLSEANEEADCQGGQNSSPDAVSEPGTPRFEVKWLIPATTRIWEGSHGVLMAEVDGLQAAGVFTVRAFPATHSEEYLSLRFFDDHGRETEIGMIRALSEWPPEVQELLRRSLNRRYLLRIMQTIFAHQQAGGLVLCSGTTDEGPVEFTVRNDPHHAARFGNQGWLLTDLEGNHYLVADLNELPFLQRRLFRLVFQEI